MFKYKELINNLSWDYDDDIQNQAIEELSRLPLSEINYLIQPNGKDCWHNAAIVISNIVNKNKNSIQEEEEVLFSLIEWAKDLNWPGALIIVDILTLLDENLVVKIIRKALEMALKDKDICWIDSLKIIVQKCEYIKKENFESDDSFKILFNQ